MISLEIIQNQSTQIGSLLMMILKEKLSKENH